eukprot:COSAG05_NODE_195_length_14550_cov_203.233686_16_plen_98_part_00
MHEYVNFVHDPEKQYRSLSEWSATGVCVSLSVPLRLLGVDIRKIFAASVAAVDVGAIKAAGDDGKGSMIFGDFWEALCACAAFTCAFAATVARMRRH